MNTCPDGGHCLNEDALERTYTALAEINKHNPIHNDLEAYLFDLAEWGMYKSEKRPLPKSFGLLEE